MRNCLKLFYVRIIFKRFLSWRWRVTRLTVEALGFNYRFLNVSIPHFQFEWNIVLIGVVSAYHGPIQIRQDVYVIRLLADLLLKVK